jgi:hypothetical protein
MRPLVLGYTAMLLVTAERRVPQEQDALASTKYD